MITASSSDGAGIGTGFSGKAGTIAISGGTVTAKGGEGARDIGDSSPDSTKFSTGENGTAVIYADNVNDWSGAHEWSCRVYSLDRSHLTIYGDYTLTENMTVAEGQTLTFYYDSSKPSNPDLTVAGGVTLSVYGKFDNQGSLVNNGEVRIYKGGDCPNGASEGNPVLFETDYLDDNAQTQTVWARRLTNGYGSIVEGGWYLVDQELTAYSPLQIEADVNLILADGATFENQSEIWLLRGSLNIWAQSTGDSAGKMDISGSSGMGTASIRGDGDLTIHGGDVTVSMPDPADPQFPTGYTHCIKLDSGSLTVTGGSLKARITYWDQTTSPGPISAKNVTISGGTVEASTLSGTFSTGENGHAILYVKTIEDTSNRANWDCIRFPSLTEDGIVYGSVTLAQNLVVPSGVTLALPSGTSLTVPDTVTLQNEGSIHVDLGGAYNGKQPTPTFVEYQVAFDTDGDGYSDDQRFYTYGTTLSPAAPTKPDDDQYSYTFTGWSPALETVTEPAKYTAQFDKTTKQYTLSATSGEGYTVAFENYTENTPANYGTAITFRVEVAPGYSETDAFAVKANGTALTAQNGVYTLTLTENTTLTVEGVADITAPENLTVSYGTDEFKEFLNNITFGLFFKESTEVSFAADDETSGVASVEYIRSETLLTEDQLKASTAWTAYSGPIAETVADAKAFVYYGKVTDNAGNVTVFGADGVIFDTAAPSIGGVTNGGTYYTTQTATVTDVNPDVVTLNGETVASPVTLAGDTDATYTLTATDKAGNKAQITVTMKPIASLTAPLEGLTPDNVTSEDKAVLESVQADVEQVLNNDPMTEDERAKLEEIQTGIEQMLNALEEAQNAGSTESIDKVEDITSDNVKPEDKDDLEQAKEDLENALTDHGDNYTDEEKAQLEEDLDRIESALESLEKVEKVKEAIDALPDSLEPDDLDTVQKTEAAKELYDQLTEHEKELLGSAAAEKLNRLLADAAAYRILEGDKSTWTLGSTGGLTITANGSPKRLTEMQLDGKTLAAENYTVRSGSTIFTLAPGYLNSLAQGAHTLTFVYENDQTTATFTVAAAPAPGTDTNNNGGTANTSGVPQTGDQSNLMLWLCLLTASALGLLAIALVKRKRA